MLFEVTSDGGLGFCHESLPNLLPTGYHGPLVVVLDANVLIDLREHGNRLLDGDGFEEIEAVYRTELTSLGELLNLWLLRDIRFIVTPRSLTDARNRTEQFVDRQLPSIQAVAESLQFQSGDWEAIPPPQAASPSSIGNVDGIPVGADRDLVLEGQAMGAHVFLTRDRRLLENAVLTGPLMRLLPPSALWRKLREAGVGLFAGGNCGAPDCPYGDWALPAPDLGKWGPFLSIFE